MAGAATSEERLRREIQHHRELAGRHTEEIWGWDTPAGHMRADRRARFSIELDGITRGARVLELGCGTGEITRRYVSDLVARVGFARSRVRYFDFLRPATPSALVARLASLGEWLEAVPWLRAIAGSMLIYAKG